MLHSVRNPMGLPPLPPGGPLLRTLQGHTDCVNAMAVTPDGGHAVSASRDGTLKVWELATGRVVVTFHADAPLERCAVARERRLIVCGDGLGRLHFLRLGLS